MVTLGIRRGSRSLWGSLMHDIVRVRTWVGGKRRGKVFSTLDQSSMSIKVYSALFSEYPRLLERSCTV
jgi:hypothetical protein